MVRKATKTIAKVKKTAAQKTGQKTALTPRKKHDRNAHCFSVCGPKECVMLCFTKNGAVTGEGQPCHFCNHGHFCKNDVHCLSCGVVRGAEIKPYKGN